MPSVCQLVGLISRDGALVRIAMVLEPAILRLRLVLAHQRAPVYATPNPRDAEPCPGLRCLRPQRLQSRSALLVARRRDPAPL